MYILGITNTADSGAALFENGEILGVVQEERLARRKNIRSFPNLSIDYLLDRQAIGIDKIDYIAVGAWKGIDSSETLPLILDELLPKNGTRAKTALMMKKRLLASISSDRRQRVECLEQLRVRHVPATKISFHDHHLAHALTAFIGSGFKNPLVLTADLRGDHRSLVLWRGCEGPKLELIDATSEFHSLGAFYAIITTLLGFTPDRHEGKVMGLAAFGNPRKALPIMRKMIGFAQGRISAHLGPFYQPYLRPDLPDLVQTLRSFSREDIAAAAQKQLETIILGYLGDRIGRLGLKRIELALAGGLFNNVSLNGKIAELAEIERIFVFPNMGDGGCAYGGALAKMIELHQDGQPQRFRPLTTVNLGPGYDRSDILDLLKATNTPYRLPGKPSETAAAYLAEGYIVGWFNGRAEYGPRALGNRSILFPATDPRRCFELNKRLGRDQFMPFAPVILASHADEYLLDFNPGNPANAHMTMTYRAKARMKKHCPAAVHIDGTVRPQIIDQETNPDYHAVISAYHALTGIPVLINTSFNLHEEPIVCSPEHALKTFSQGAADLLFIEGILVGSERIR